MIDRFIQRLHAAGLELSEQEISESLWLAQFLPEPRMHAPEATQEPLDLGPLDDEPDDPAQGLEPGEGGASSEPQTSGATPEASAVLPPVRPATHVRAGGDNLLEFHSPSAPALPHKLELARGLRPLRRRVPSRLFASLDERATAERIADEGLWVPVLRPAMNRWMDAILVVDRGRSMAIWRKTLSELEQVLQGQGAFRDVRTWELDTNEAQGPLRLKPMGSAIASERSPQELVESRGRRLILVVSDCVSPAWHSGQVARLMEGWGRHGPVVLVQLLPPSLWGRTALRRAVAAELHGRFPGVPNRKLDFKPLVELADDGRQRVVMPVVTLERGSLERWARMVVGRPNAWALGVLLGREPVESRQPVTGSAVRALPAPLTAAERVRRFRGTASPTAQTLAGLLAATPLSLPVMRLVWQTMLPEAEQIHLAEVFLGGLFREVQTDEPPRNADEVQYDFYEGVRDLLLESVSINDSLEVFRRTTRFLERRLGQAFDFRAILSDPAAATARGLRPFAHVAATVLRRLGGEYAEFADRLEGRAVRASEPGSGAPLESSQAAQVAAPANEKLSELQAVVAQMEVPGMPGVFVLGGMREGATPYARQVEALNLIHGLFELGALKKGTTVTIVGPNLGGVTAAAGAALRGCAAHLLVDDESLLPSIQEEGKRWLHPRIPDWPRAGAEDPRVVLPGLSWQAGPSVEVARQIIQSFYGLLSSVHKIELHTKSGDLRSLSHSGEAYQLSASGSRGGMAIGTKVVILDLSQSIEHRLTSSFSREIDWVQDVVSGRFPVGSPGRVLISGDGDRSLEDMLYVLLRDFRSDTIVDRLLSSDELQGVRRQLVTIEAHLRVLSPEARQSWLEKQYNALEVPRSFDRALLDMVRPETSVVVCEPGAYPIRPEISMLYRFLTSRLLRLGIVTYTPQTIARVDVLSDSGSGYSVRYSGEDRLEHFDHVLLYEGRRLAPETVLREIWERFRQRRREDSVLESMWRPLWPPEAFDPGRPEAALQGAPVQELAQKGNSKSPPSTPRGPLVWAKKLAASDAQRVKEGSNPVGGIRLTQARFKFEGQLIDQTTYFRDQLFGRYKWEIQTAKSESAMVLFDVTMLGNHLGVFELQVRHKPSGEARQGNYTTILILGPLAEHFREHDVTGRQFMLYAPPKGKDGPFVIDIV